MTSGIECRGCGGDCRYCNCEYQQTVSADLQKEADKALKKLSPNLLKKLSKKIISS